MTVGNSVKKLGGDHLVANEEIIEKSYEMTIALRDSVKMEDILKRNGVHI